MLKKEDTALIVIDVQGSLAKQAQESDNLIYNVQTLIMAFQILEIPIIYMEQYPEGLGCSVSEISSLLSSNKVIAKTSFSGCGSNAFIEQLQAIDKNQLLICGIETHVCVYQTVVDLLDRDFYIEVISDAVSSRAKENRQLALNKMQQLGASLTSVEMCLFEILRNSKSDKFKEISRLLKERS